MRKFNWFIILSFILSAWLMGCGDDQASLIIRNWQYPWSSITVGSQAPLTVELSDAVTEKTYVDITNTFTTFVMTDPPEVITFKEGENKKNVTIKGLAVHDQIKLTFTLRGTSSKKDFIFTVDPEK
jgi:hypothetical protein